MKNESDLSSGYPKCEDCLHWRDELCHFASPFLAKKITQRRHHISPNSLNCGIEGKNFVPKDNNNITGA